MVRLSNRPPQNAVIKSADRLLELGKVEVTFRDEPQSLWAPLNYAGEALMVNASDVTVEAENQLITVRYQSPSNKPKSFAAIYLYFTFLFFDQCQLLWRCQFIFCSKDNYKTLYGPQGLLFRGGTFGTRLVRKRLAHESGWCYILSKPIFCL